MWQPTGQWRTAVMRWYGGKTPLPPADWEPSLLCEEAPDSESIVQVAVGQIDGVTLLPDVWYGVDLTRRTVN